MKENSNTTTTSVDNAPVLMLHDELASIRADASTWCSRMRENDDAFHCWWEGQSEDGRKRKKELGFPALPWEGASDTRFRLVDDLVTKESGMLTLAWQKSRRRVMPTEAGDYDIANRLQKLQDWVFDTQMEQLGRQVRLLTHIRQKYGVGVLHYGWREEPIQVLRAVSLVQLQQQASALEKAEMPNDLLNRFLTAFAAEQDDEALDAAQAMMPEIKRKVLREMLDQLREFGETELPVEEPRLNAPYWQSLTPFKDVFFPVESESLEEARVVFTQEFLSEAEVEQRAIEEDWNGTFKEQVLKSKGARYFDYLRESGDSTLKYQEVTDAADLCEIFNAWYQAEDEDTGTPGVWHTVFSMHCSSEAGMHERWDSTGVRLPFTAFCREINGREILSSRGIGEVARWAQMDIKAMRDGRKDRASLNAMPPRTRPIRSIEDDTPFAPGSVFATMSGEQMQWMTPPPLDGGSVEIERAELDFIWQMFGRGPLASPVDQQMYREGLVNAFLEEMRAPMQRTMQLVLENMDAQEAERVIGNVGNVFGQSAKAQRLYDVRVGFDTRNYDPEWAKKKIELAQVALQVDTTGVTDRAALTQLLFADIDPSVADMVVRPQSAADQQQAEDERTKLAQIVSGIEPERPERGVNHRVRLAALQEALQANPMLAQRMGEDAQQILAARVEWHQAQLQQEQNAMIGREGAQRALPQGPVASRGNPGGTY